jgi:hypothetical protein
MFMQVVVGCFLVLDRKLRPRPTAGALAQDFWALRFNDRFSMPNHIDGTG